MARLSAAATEQIRSVIAAQDAIELDVISEGEVTRRDYWSYFVLGLDGTTFLGAVPTQVGTRTIALARVRVSRALRPKHLYVVEDWRTAQSFTLRPVKISLPGPLTCATYVEDVAYGTREALSFAFAAAINEYVQLLVQAGCRYIQVDDPQLAYQPDAALEYGLDHLGRCFTGVGAGVTRIVHICRGTPAFPSSYDGHGKAPDRNCYDILLPAINDLVDVDMISVEHAFCPSPPATFKHVTRKALMLGVVDVASIDVEPVTTMVERARPVLDVIDPECLVLAPDCGFSAWNATLAGQQYDAAMAKLTNMVDAARQLNRELGWG
jgi:5-methyltetrahydropteroyltriglutamate--homocysteine methyltransferase